MDLDLFHSTLVIDALGDFESMTSRLSRITRLTISLVDIPASPARRSASATACLMVSFLDFFFTNAAAGADEVIFTGFNATFFGFIGLATFTRGFSPSTGGVTASF